MSQTVWIEVRGHELNYISNFFNNCEDTLSKSYCESHGLEIEIIGKNLPGHYWDTFPHEHMAPATFLNSLEKYGEEYIKAREADYTRKKKIMLYACPIYLLNNYATKRNCWAPKAVRIAKPKGNMYNIEMFRNFYKAPFINFATVQDDVPTFWEAYKKNPAPFLTINLEKRKANCNREIVITDKNITSYVPSERSTKILEIIHDKLHGKPVVPKTRVKPEIPTFHIAEKVPKEELCVFPIFPNKDTRIGLCDYKKLPSKVKRQLEATWTHKYVFKGVFEADPINLNPNTYAMIVNDTTPELNLHIQSKIINHEQSLGPTLLNYTRTCYFDGEPTELEIESSRALGIISVAQVIIFPGSSSTPADKEYNDNLNTFFHSMVQETIN